MMEELPANVVKRVMDTATTETRAIINQYLHYPENSATSNSFRSSMRALSSFMFF